MSSGFRLIVSEKPSVARDIARVLGVRGGGKGFIGTGDVRITWCVGHLVELADPHVYDPSWKSWRLETLPMIPDEFILKPRKSGRDQWKIVRKLLRDSMLAEVVNACDAGREGELIFAFAYQLAACRAPVQRLWISSMTDTSIRDGFLSLRAGASMKSLEDAARCRAESDWLVGLNATRAMTVRMRQPGGASTLLSLGRVQTPTLALLDERERAIEEFTPETFWQVKVRFVRDEGDAKSDSWVATWTSRDPKLKPRDRLFDKTAAEAIIERIDDEDGVVSKVERKTKRERPPLLYDLTNLQKEANRRYKFTASRTLELAQDLYEKHKVLTYPRTDSRHLGSDQVSTLRGLFESLRFGPYLTAADDIISRWPFKPGKRVVDDAEVSDHHAIIPTGVDPRTCRLSPDEKRIYDLVARRFLAVFFGDAVFAAVVIETTIGKDLFVARGRTRIEAGWQDIDPPPSKKKPDGSKRSDTVVLPLVNEGDEAENLGAKLQEGVTKPPKRYTEATLLGAMERAGEGLDDAELKRAMKRKGLGTPATRASIIETLLARKYIKREKNLVVPTPQGRGLLRALPVEAIRSPRLTGEWEARLAALAEGEGSRNSFMADIRDFVTSVVKELVNAKVDPEVGEMLFVAPDGGGELLGTCPRCGGEVRTSQRGWACSGCPFTLPGVVAKRTISTTMAKKLLVNGETATVKGFKSKAGKPFRAGLKLDGEGKVVFDFPEQEILGECPACHQPVRKRGDKVYTCDSGRSCPFVIPVTFDEREIPESAVRELLSNGKSKPLDGFVRPVSDGRAHGKSFVGVLEWNGNRVVVSEVDPRATSGSAGPCPRCGKPVSFARQARAWRCSGCSFRIPDAIARRELRHQEVAELLAHGRTGRLHGFRQKKGTVFKAALVLDPEEGLSFDFSRSRDDGVEPVPAGGPPPAFGVRVNCPVCIFAAEPDPGYVIAGHEAWGCSRWRQGCHLRVPFVVEGTRIPDDEAQRLFSGKKATRYLKEPIGPPGKRKASRIVLHPDQKPCWTVEAKRARKRS